MMRQVLAVVVGYVVMFAMVFATFTNAYFAMGTDRAFRPGTYDISVLWIVVSVVLSLIAAAVGGFICAKLSKGGRLVCLRGRDRRSIGGHEQQGRSHASSEVPVISAGF